MNFCAQAADIRLSILDMIKNSRSSHIGSAYSIVDILTVLYFDILSIDPKNPTDENRDKFLLSKAHASSALYATLSHRGFFPAKTLMKYYVDGGVLPGHLDMEAVPGIEISAGSLGHGLPMGLGMAIANNQTKNPGHVYVLVGDGECNEGSVWEAVMLASTLKLKNVTAIVDFNKWQGYGATNEVVNQANMAERWQAFGWEVIEVDGHNHEELVAAFRQPQQGPKVIVAHTIKGKGVSFMEDTLEWHYKSPTDEQYEIAVGELRGQLTITNKQ